MMTIMIIFERDKPRNILLWSLVFLFTQVIGYLVYLFSRYVFYKKKNSLAIKEKEDEIYRNLIKKNLNKVKHEIDDDLLNFSSLAYNAVGTINNSYEIFTKYSKFKDSLLKDLSNASSYILFEVSKVNKNDFIEIKDVLISKAKSGVAVKLVFDNHICFKWKKELKQAGVRVYRFSKYNTVGRIFANHRNQVVIDGKMAYLGNLNVNAKMMEEGKEVSCAYIKVKGNIVQEINLTTHQDTVFASGKFQPYTSVKSDSIKNSLFLQYISNNLNTDIELLLIKAICTAKSNITLHLDQFIPTESIMSLLKYAINSNIDVRLMVPLKTKQFGKYYATRAYAKELALMGANVYLYDGYIFSNSIVIDDSYVLYGSFLLNREHINTGLQSVLIFNDAKAITYFKKQFDIGINNSYRINDAKYMLIREKFYKNFV